MSDGLKFEFDDLSYTDAALVPCIQTIVRHPETNEKKMLLIPVVESEEEE